MPPTDRSPTSVTDRLSDTRVSAGAGDAVAAKKQHVLELLKDARTAIDRGDLARATQRVRQAVEQQVPDSAFQAGEDRPWLVALKLDQARGGRGEAATATAAGDDSASERVGEGVVLAQATEPILAPAPEPVTPRKNRANDQAPSPIPLPSVAAKNDPAKPATTPSPTLLDKASTEQTLLVKKVSSDVLHRLAEARATREHDPKTSLKQLGATRAMVASAGLDADAKAMLLRRVDRSIRETKTYLADHRAEIEFNEQNQAVRNDVKRQQHVKLEVDQKLADLVDQFNTLRDEQRFEEMEVVAKRARELAPDKAVVQQLWREARFIRRIMDNQELKENKENGVFQALFQTELAAIPPQDDDPFKHPDAKVWKQLSESRARLGREGTRHRTERELQIEKKLKSPVLLRFTDTPLAEVINQLMRLTGVNIHLDERGLVEEGITSDTPVTINLSDEISLKSALNLILEPLHLSFVIKDEVLKITSEHLRDGEVYIRTYDVADLVIPIPNFNPSSQFGLQGAINDAHAALGYGPASAGSFGTMGLVTGQPGAGSTGTVNGQLMAQVPGMPGIIGGRGGGGGGGPVSGAGVPFTSGGPGGLGGGVQPDFDSLIELITTTIEPDSWDEVGGAGSIAPFETNLSLVVSQTQDVHEQIVDLLEQLRRLQDLQVTIEVRFITLSDNFFERIGIDFDFNIRKSISNSVSTQIDQTGSGRLNPITPSATVGIQAGVDPHAFTADLDIPFSQGSFLAATPAFGGFDPGQAANFGFAILSDIEAFFLVQAAQGDSRSNILQAPKVTLFNGQQAFVSDTSQSPFVISVIPVVGDFAAAQQPVIVVLSEGTSMSVQAVVSPDRRYVRLTVVPFFSQIGDVKTFTFEGSSTTKASSSSAVDDQNKTNSTTKDDQTVRTGTTVQLPTFAFTTVTTTVSVPDGGTVLLGGIKRLSEGRKEFGVPLLSKVPYVDRLFRNVGIGRDTTTFMMMVTPRIIIQEEEEERLLGASPQ